MSVGVIIEHHVRAGQRDAIRTTWERLLRPAIEANDEHEAYTYMYDLDDPDVIRAVQQYTDADAAAAFPRDAGVRTTLPPSSTCSSAHPS